LLPASLTAGLLYDTVSSDAPFYFGAIMALAATVLMFAFIILSKKNKQTLIESK
ncbi:Multidrug resistance protein MdtH, partial [termite gut metagenome]